MLRSALVALVAICLLALAALYWLGSGAHGERWGPGEITGLRIPAEVVAARDAAQRTTARAVGIQPKQILFGDLHVHTTYSTDAFMFSLPMAGGEGAHPVAQACDFARFCSALDFWSTNDHALALTPRSWSETVDTVRLCNAAAGSAENPDVTAFLGWEWTQFGNIPSSHYGHKNVVLRDLEDDRIPSRPIAARAPPDAWDRSTDVASPSILALGLLALSDPAGGSLDLVRYFDDMLGVPDCPDGVPVRDLPVDCRESATTPADLFAKLDDWGHAAIVIPHGTTWGYYTPQGSSWDKQLEGAMHDPSRQTLIEVFSGHGNSEEYRAWREVELTADGARLCPPPRPDHQPSCQRAGEIIRTRCTEAGESDTECERRAALARQHYVDGDVFGHLTVPGARVEDWLDSGQCRDCFQPAFNLRPRSSVQYIMALRSFANPTSPRRFHLGFIAASDVHSARPGTGYKEYARTEMTEARFAAISGPLAGVDAQKPAPASAPFDPETTGARFFGLRETERQASFFVTGGLAAVHATGRSRGDIWDALERKEVYGTSGPRILLWFDLVNGPDGGPVPMGSQVALSEPPRFTVRAVGSLEQQPGCPGYAEEALGAEQLQRMCRGECYHPSDRRRRISRTEVVRIRPQISAGEVVDTLIEDPWRSFPCPADQTGCAVTFVDPEFASSGRDALYYVRAIEEPSLAVNAGNLRCTRGADGTCLEVRPCSSMDAGEDCLAPTEERAWSSPIYVAPSS